MLVVVVGASNHCRRGLRRYQEFDQDSTEEGHARCGPGRRPPANKALADRAEQELKRRYINRSLYGAEVVTTVTPIERNRVNLTFTVTEGEPRQDQRDPHRGQQGLQRVHPQGPVRSGHRWLASWYTRATASRAKLNADLETLRSYYLSAATWSSASIPPRSAISPDEQNRHHHQRDEGRAFRRIGRQA